jgi:hypothetical protein
MPISADDFGRMSVPFRLWLKRSRSLLLFDLPKDEARRLFDAFVEAYNKGAIDGDLLQDKYAVEEAASLPRTSHKWALKLSGNERQQLETVRDSVTAAAATVLK